MALNDSNHHIGLSPLSVFQKKLSQNIQQLEVKEASIGTLRTPHVRASHAPLRPESAYLPFFERNERQFHVVHRRSEALHVPFPHLAGDSEIAVHGSLLPGGMADEGSRKPAAEGGAVVIEVVRRDQRRDIADIAPYGLVVDINCPEVVRAGVVDEDRGIAARGIAIPRCPPVPGGEEQFEAEEVIQPVIDAGAIPVEQE